MYKTGALLRPQHFSEGHKCRTNGVRKPRAADGGQQGSPGPWQNQAAEWWLTGDKTHESPSPTGRARAALRVQGGGYKRWWAQRGAWPPRSVVSALTPALTGGAGPLELGGRGDGRVGDPPTLGS